MVSYFKRKQKGNLLHRFLLMAGAILILIFSISLMVANIKINKKKQQLTVQIESLEKKIEDMKSKNIDLKEGILMANDDKYIERVAREELDLQKPGEKVISFIKSPDEKKEEKVMLKNIFQVWSAWISSMASFFKK